MMVTMSIAKTISINGGPPQLGTLTGNTTNWTFTISGTGPRPVPAAVDVVITTSRGRYRGAAVIDDAKYPASRAVVRWTACIRSTGPLTRERDPSSEDDGGDREGSYLQRITGKDD
jgi:hypothetical protein